MDLQKSAGLIAVSGIFLLVMLMILDQPSEKTIAEVNSRDINKYIQIHGTIEKITTHKTKAGETMQKLRISDNTGTIEVILFQPSSSTIPKNQAKISGKVSRYNGNLQIIADKVIL